MLNRVRTDLERTVEPAYRRKIAELVPTGITIIGVRIRAIHKITQAWHQANKDTAPETALNLLAAAFTRRRREEFLFVTVVTSRLKKNMAATQITPQLDHGANSKPLIDFEEVPIWVPRGHRAHLDWRAVTALQLLVVRRFVDPRP